MTANMMHLLSLNFPISTLFCEDDPVRRLSCQPRIGHASSKNAVTFHPRTTKRVSPQCAKVTEPEKTFLCMDLSRLTLTQTGDIDVLCLLRCIRTRDHPF